jgi:predicted alpha/beta hydrolase
MQRDLASPNARTPVRARTTDGVALHGDLVTPREPRAVAVLAHAMMVDRRTMDRPRGEGLASTLAERGIAVASFDLRGHGESGPTAREGARWSYDDLVGHDMPTLVAWARARFPGMGVSVVGHSLGGNAALVAAGLDAATAPDAIVGLAVNQWMPSLEPSWVRRLGKRAILRAWLAATRVGGGLFDPRTFRAGTDAEPLPYVAQLARICREDRFTSEDGSIDYREAIGRVRVPYLAVASEGDEWMANPASVRRFTALAKGARLEQRLVRHGEFGARAPDHMGLVTRATSRPLWDEIARWILRTIA